MISIVEGDFKDVFELEGRIPEFNHRHRKIDLEKRLSAQGLVLKAFVENKFIGIKAGYPINTDIFYSWIGGVLPEYRGQHVAQKLLERQEEVVIEKGHRLIRVKTMNRFQSMILFLLKNGYLIHGYEDLGDKWRSKILFEKELIS